MPTSPNAREADKQDFDFDFAFARGHELLRGTKQEHPDSGDGISGGQRGAQLPLWWPVEWEALLSILLQKPLGSCSFRSKKPPFWSAAWARSNFEPEIPPGSTPGLGELSPKQITSQRDLKPDICPGQRRHDRCFVDFLIAPSYIFEPPISFPCWDLHWKLGCEEAAAAWDCTDAWQNPQLQGKDAKTRRKCWHCTTGTCDVPFLCFTLQQLGSLVLPKTHQTLPTLCFSACPLVQPNSVSAVPSAVVPRRKSKPIFTCLPQKR